MSQGGNRTRVAVLAHVRHAGISGMLVNIARLSEGLLPSGFCFLPERVECDTKIFFRPTEHLLFERLLVVWTRSFGIPGGEFASAYVECSIAPGQAVTEAMAVRRDFTDISDLGLESPSRLLSEEDGRKWEGQLIEVGPSIARRFAVAEAPSLLQRTASPRDAVRRYGELIGFNHDLTRLVVALNKRVSGRQRKEVGRILTKHIMELPRINYEVAALTIAACASDVKGNPEWYFGFDAAKREYGDYLIELHLLASRFAKEPGWPES